jgi:RNA polymerase sigma-70 factor, ECF subfamily
VVGVIRTDSRAPQKSPDGIADNELFAHCYRMVGSVHEAEDLVQETHLRAWQAIGSFERRASMRTWLYRIATNACLNAMDGARRRALPMQLWPASDPSKPVTERPDVPWLEPLPLAQVGGANREDSPENTVTERESLRLAFVAMLQTLPPRQRAILLLRDVLRFKATETAEILDTTTTAVNSGLRRAREQVAARTTEMPSEPAEPERRQRLDQYVAAWEAKDVPAIVALLTSDAVWEMPPLTAWYRGAEHIGRTSPSGARCHGWCAVPRVRRRWCRSRRTASPRSPPTRASRTAPCGPRSCRCSTSAPTGLSTCTRSSTRGSSSCSVTAASPGDSRGWLTIFRSDC